MSDRPRTGPIPDAPIPDDRRGDPNAPDAAGFDVGGIHDAIADLTADVHRGPVHAVELPQAHYQPTPGGPDFARIEEGFAPTDEHLAVETNAPISAPAPPPAPSIIAPATPPPMHIRPPTGAPPMASSPPPMASSPPPQQRPIQNVETAFVRNPLLEPRPASQAPRPPVVQSAAPSVAPAPGPYEPTGGQPEVQQLPRGRLVVQGGDWNGTTWYLNRTETRLGRGEKNDIVVLDIGVSRQHLIFARHAEGFRLIDLGSGNGTYVNGQRAGELELYDGDRIDMGHTTLVFGTIGPPRLRGGEGSGGRSMPTVWLVAMALITFLTVLGTMYLVRNLREGGSSADAQVAVVQEAVARRSWSEARAAIETARNDDVDDERLTRLGAQIESESKAASVVERAKAVLNAEPATGGERVDAAKAVAAEVESILADVPADSVYAADARNLKRRAQKLAINARLDKAEDFLGGGRTAAARILVEQVLREDAGHVRAKSMLKRIEAQD